jgi:CRISPR/Cas system CMR-associated protein Cmr5 small subunit
MKKEAWSTKNNFVWWLSQKKTVKVVEDVMKKMMEYSTITVLHMQMLKKI